MTQTNWTAKVLFLFSQNNLRWHLPNSALNVFSQVVLIHAGLTSLIAHIRVGLMQVALEAKSAVQPAIGRFPGFNAFICADFCIRLQQVVGPFRSYSSSVQLLSPARSSHFPALNPPERNVNICSKTGVLNNRTTDVPFTFLPTARHNCWRAEVISDHTY